ncbi:hypothetical protein KAJ83_15965 [Marivibrio halodurans]|uniref:Uncharacterized protein n=1 Tax=Marivibrio halodurans TaxID=2039722 RepID=A0A8J7SKJ6_9PROT|nr:hypothetical protein [Marivibrio halodurans]MBP5858518.1 hypothetical protein [Marivibrio halodurans]
MPTRTLPYSVTTAGGDRFEIDFDLHPETVSPMRVEQLITTILRAVERDIGITGETSNGDVLQAIAMATAIRARMIHAPTETTERIARDLVNVALRATGQATHGAPPAGSA